MSRTTSTLESKTYNNKTPIKEEDRTMRRMNSLFTAIIIAIISINLLSPLEVSAANTCALSGCDSNCSSGSSYCRLHTCQKENCHKLRNNNGTIYCDTHAQQYVNSQDYTPCAVSGCYRRQTSGSSYCYEHKCNKSDCSSKAASGSEYCTSHKAKPANKKTTTYKKTTTSKTTKSKSTQKKYKYDSYDVNEYDDPDDFADEWAEEFGDGNFDDGYDDAYDYWEDEYE